MGQTPSAAQVGTVVTLKELSNEKFVIGKILRGGMGVASRIIWHTSDLIIWRTSCESGVERLGEGIFRGNMKL